MYGGKCSLLRSMSSYIFKPSWSYHKSRNIGSVHSAFQDSLNVSLHFPTATLFPNTLLHSYQAHCSSLTGLTISSTIFPRIPQ